MKPFLPAILSASVVVVVVVAACSGAPRAPERATAPSASSTASVPVASASAAVPALDPATVTVTTLAIPASVQLDGDPSEWGALDALPPAVGGETAQKAGLSHVGLALDGEAIHLVGSVGGAAKKGFTLALLFEAKAFPPIGLAGRSVIYSLEDCSNPLGPDWSRFPKDLCEDLRAAYEKFKAEQSARFTRVLHVDESGVTSNVSSEALARVRFKSKPTATGFTFEADLPVDFLPRCTAAPIEHIALAAAPGFSSSIDEGTFVTASFDAPVHFEPYRAVREDAFARAATSYDLTVVSYQPGDWNKIEVVERSPSEVSLEASVRPLYTKLGGDGDVEFGQVHVSSYDIVALRAGVITGRSSFHNPPAPPIRRRMGGEDGWLLVSAWDEPVRGEGYQDAGFDACFIRAADGQSTELWSGSIPVWESVKTSVSANLEVLTLRGTQSPRVSDFTAPPPKKTYVWKLDPSKGVYVQQP